MSLLCLEMSFHQHYGKKTKQESPFFEVVDALGLQDSIKRKPTDDMVGFGRILVVNEDGSIDDTTFFKNVITDQGRYLTLQRLSGIPGSPDLTDYTVRFFAVGDGASISSNSLLPESATVYDTDLAHILPAFNDQAAVDGKYMPITTASYEAQYILHFQIVISGEVLKDRVRINEIGLYAANSDNTDFKLFARATISEVVLLPNRYYIGDWWVVLRKIV